MVNKKIKMLKKVSNETNKKIKKKEPLLEKINKKLGSFSVSIPLALSFLLTPLRFNFNKTGFTPVELNKARAQEVNINRETTQLIEKSEEIKRKVKDALLSGKEKENMDAFKMLVKLNEINRSKIKDKYHKGDLDQQLFNIIAYNEIKDSVELIDTVISLIARGADPGAKDDEGKEVILYACDQDNLMLFKLLAYTIRARDSRQRFSITVDSILLYNVGVNIHKFQRYYIKKHKIQRYYTGEVIIKREPNIKFIEFIVKNFYKEIYLEWALAHTIAGLITVNKSMNNETNKELRKKLTNQYIKIGKLLIKYIKKRYPLNDTEYILDGTLALIFPYPLGEPNDKLIKQVAYLITGDSSIQIDTKSLHKKPYFEEWELEEITPDLDPFNTE